MKNKVDQARAYSEQIRQQMLPKVSQRRVRELEEQKAKTLANIPKNKGGNWSPNARKRPVNREPYLNNNGKSHLSRSQDYVEDYGMRKLGDRIRRDSIDADRINQDL